MFKHFKKSLNKFQKCPQDQAYLSPGSWYQVVQLTSLGTSFFIQSTWFFVCSFILYICTTYFFPYKSNHYWEFYFWQSRYRRLPPSGGKQEKLNFVTNTKSGLFIKFEIDSIKNAPSRSINMNNGFLAVLPLNNGNNR